MCVLSLLSLSLSVSLSLSLSVCVCVVRLCVCSVIGGPTTSTHCCLRCKLPLVARQHACFGPCSSHTHHCDAWRCRRVDRAVPNDRPLNADMFQWKMIDARHWQGKL